MFFDYINQKTIIDKTLLGKDLNYFINIFSVFFYYFLLCLYYSKITKLGCIDAAGLLPVCDINGIMHKPLRVRVRV